jgi:hypothetical protein
MSRFRCCRGRWRDRGGSDRPVDCAEYVRGCDQRWVGAVAESDIVRVTVELKVACSRDGAATGGRQGRAEKDLPSRKTRIQVLQHETIDACPVTEGIHQPRFNHQGWEGRERKTRARVLVALSTERW